EADNVLADLGLGRAHHRVIYFIGRQPGMTVSDLLSILKITKQSLSRVLSHLVAEGHVHQAQGARDKRQRLLSLT
ncbi:MAG: MarR family winged helix-turn-helix transcriptional regulator, partial [Candidatus Puniceispirillaceae bacterium]